MPGEITYKDLKEGLEKGYFTKDDAHGIFANMERSRKARIKRAKKEKAEEMGMKKVKVKRVPEMAKGGKAKQKPQHLRNVAAWKKHEILKGKSKEDIADIVKIINRAQELERTGDKGALPPAFTRKDGKIVRKGETKAPIPSAKKETTRYKSKAEWGKLGKHGSAERIAEYKRRGWALDHTTGKPDPKTKPESKTEWGKKVTKRKIRFVEGVGETDLTDEELKEFGMFPEPKKEKVVKKEKVSGKDLQKKAEPKPDEEVKPSKLSPTTVSDMRAKQKELLTGLKKTKTSKILAKAKKAGEKREFKKSIADEKAKRMKEAKKSKLRKGIDSLKKMLGKKKEDKLKKSGVGLHLEGGGYLPTSSIPAPPPFRQGMRMMGHGGQVSVSNDKAGAGDVHTTHSHSGYKAGE